MYHGNILIPTTFCLISQLPLFDLQKKCLVKMYESYVNSINSTKKQNLCLEFYISLTFHHLYYNSEWKNEVEIIYNNQHKNKRAFLRYRNYKPTGFTLPNFTFKSLLETMKPNRVLELIKYLLLEKKILLVQNHYSDNAVIIESLLTLLSPL